MQSEGTDRSRDEIREDARARAELAAARLAGATEAVMENIDELTGDFEEAVHEAADITQHSAQEFRRQAAAPEVQQAKETIKQNASRMRHKISVEEGKVVHRVEELEEKAEEKLRKAGRSTKSLAKVARIRARQAGHAATETGRRAARAPAEVGRDLQEAFSSWKTGVASSMGLYALAGAIGAAAFVVLTVGLVGAANVWLGAPWGTLLVAGAYIVLAAVAVGAAKSAKAKARAESQEQMEEARDTLQHVVQPMKDFWSDRDDVKAAARAAFHGGLPAATQETGVEPAHETQSPQRPPRPQRASGPIREDPYLSQHEEERP